MQNENHFIAAQEYLQSSVLSGMEELYSKGDERVLESQNMSHQTKLKLISTILHLLEKENLSPQSVLDVCCGDGKLTEAFSLIFPNSQGFDACENAIGQNKVNSSKPENYFVGDALFPEKYLKQKYDLIIIHQAHMLKRPVLGNVSESEYEGFYVDFLNKYLECLNPGGMLLISHGINGPEHIKPERLTNSFNMNLFSLKLPALLSLFPSRFKSIAYFFDALIAKLFKRKVTSFYITK